MLFANLDPVTLVLRIPALLMAFTFHEFGHAWVATLLGDDTPKAQGRLTLSPLAHIDIMGAVLILLTGFGWARPVQVNTSRLKFRPWGDIAVSLAGVFMNLVLGMIFFALYLLAYAGVFGTNPIIPELFNEIFKINVVLIGFNLIPLPPLDGFRVARYLLPRSMDNVVYALYRMGPMLLMVLLISHLSDPFLIWMYTHVKNLIAVVMVPPTQFFYNLLH